MLPVIHFSSIERMRVLDKIVEVENNTWPPELRANRAKFESRMQVFPRGFIIAFDHDEVKGFTTSQITTYEADTDKTWDELTDGGYIRKTHHARGDSLYVVSVGVDPNYQGEGIGTKLVNAQKEIVKEMNLKRLFLTARMPGYNQYCILHENITAQDYLQLTNENGESIDPEIRFYQRQGLYIAKILPEFEEDEASCNFGVVMMWDFK